LRCKLIGSSDENLVINWISFSPISDQISIIGP
jgi:hypothetical protein